MVVVGGGDTASGTFIKNCKLHLEEATFLTKYASKVYVLVRRDKLRASKVMADRLLAHPKVEVLWNKLPVEIVGDGRLMNGVMIKDTVTSEVTKLEGSGLFYAIGHKPNTDAFEGKLETDETGYVKTRPHPGVTSASSHTSVEGVFACGDIQDKIYRQAVTAAGYELHYKH